MTQQKATILIVDDTPTNLALLFHALEEEGYRVLVNTSGQTSLRTARQIKLDIILLDVMMPGIDGFETCRQLKLDAATADIPIIFLTALTDTIDKVKGLKLGAVDYVTKPIEIEELLARITTHLTIRNLQAEVEQRNAELLETNQKLQDALNTIKTISGIIPICAWCHNKIREDDQWIELVAYFHKHTDAKFTHGMCPDCLEAVKKSQ